MPAQAGIQVIRSAFSIELEGPIRRVINAISPDFRPLDSRLRGNDGSLSQ